MSLYRTYRPQSLADVVGQEHIVTTLEQAAKQNKLSHAYLFAGSRGTGKTSVARILAKILMIRGIEDEELQKHIIKGVEEGTIVDLLEIDAASNRGIDDIRDLIEKIQFSPVAAAAKVYIIDEVHMLTKEAFNALLKTLEEPPAYAYFILATTEINKIPETIQSRCQRFPFHRIREEDIIRRLQYIADQEHIVIDREALRAIARHVEGGMRDAIGLLDQIRSLPKITLAEVQERIGGTGQEHVDAVFVALEQRDTQALLETIRRVEEEGIPLDLFLRHLLKAIRTGLHEAIDEKKPTGEILAILDTLLEAIRDVRIAPVPGLVVESALLSLCTPEQEKKEKSSRFGFARSKEQTEAKKEEAATERKTADPAAQEPSKATRKEEAAEEPEKEGLIEAPELTLETMQDLWPEILKDVAPASVKMSLKNGHVHTLEDKRVVVSFTSTFHRDKVAETEASRAVEKIMEKIFKRSLHLECVLESIGSAPTDEGKESVNLAEAAAEIF